MSIFTINRRYSGAAGISLALLLYFGGVHSGVAAHDLLVVKGNPGQASFQTEIDAIAKLWCDAAEKGGHRLALLEGKGQETQLEWLRAELQRLAGSGVDPVWLVLLGHGNAQGHTPKFALEGPDLAADELARLLSKIRRPLVIVAGFSCSGAFVQPLAGPDRILLTATRSGQEENWTHFSKFFASAISSLDADRDADGQVSVFEAWLHACGEVEAFYRVGGRMLTEHALLDDQGGGKGWDHSALDPSAKTASKTASSTGAGVNARQRYLLPSPMEAALNDAQRARRQLLEAELAALRPQKGKDDPQVYRDSLERILLELNSIYAEVERGAAGHSN